MTITVTGAPAAIQRFCAMVRMHATRIGRNGSAYVFAVEDGCLDFVREVARHVGVRVEELGEAQAAD